ncbi:MAG TPA: 5'-3' exonuclease, partial [Fimbriimonadaceae bacterium]|nr:5'-3' exonuclease [Fimbriimonadaceae bacterium]
MRNIVALMSLLIVDGDNLAHRAYHSTPKTIEHNAVRGFFSMLVRIAAEEKPQQIFVAWDTLGSDTYRTDLWPRYQAGRVFEASIIRQLEMLPLLCHSFAFGVGKQTGFEADDLIASAVSQTDEPCLVLTADRDAYQLASDRVTILAPKRGTPVLDRIGPREVVARMGVLPEQVPDFKALSGDPSDNIPGLKGIGPKTAANLLQTHGTLEGVLESWGREEDIKLALLF